VSPAKTAEPIETMFGLWALVDSRNHALEGVQIPHGNGQFSRGKERPIVKYKDTLRQVVQKQLNRLMSFGIWAQVGTKNHILDGVQIPMGRGNFEWRKGRPL